VEANKVKRLKEALLDELIDQVENGVTAVDRESGEVVKLSTDSRVLTVAAKVIKDLAADIGDEGAEAEKARSLEQFLNLASPPWRSRHLAQ
jgi:hypothetical protein